MGFLFDIVHNMSKCIIYKISNLVNDKVYVGQTWKENLRYYFISSHVCSPNRVKLYNAIKKYGVDNFEIVPIWYCFSQDEADEIEIFFIKEYNSVEGGYNIRYGGSGGGKLSKETKEKISNSLKGKIPWNKNKITSSNVKKKISESMKGNIPWNKNKRLSSEYKKKLSEAKIGKPSNMLGKHHSEKTKEILSIKNRKFSDAEEFEIIQKYDELRSSIKIAKIFNCVPLTIRNIIKRRRGSL